MPLTKLRPTYPLTEDRLREDGAKIFIVIF